jgi:hypothetical protein
MQLQGEWTMNATSKAKKMGKLLGIMAVFFSANAQISYGLELPPQVTVRRITYAGSGCPAGSVSQNLSPDSTAFTLIFDSFVAEVGPGVPFSERRKNCQINVDLNFPSGWSFTVTQIDYRGYVSLEPGVTGLQKANYYFQGQRQSANAGTPFYGPTDKDYQVRDTVGLDAEVWSPCGASRALNINSQVRLDNRRAPESRGLLTTDSIDGTFTTKFYLNWRRCRG